VRFKFKKGEKYKSWRKWTLIFVICFLISSISIIITGTSIFTPKVNYLEDPCDKIKYVPAWIKGGEIIDYGYNKERTTLPKGYFFYYDSRCPACKKQIENFENWEEIKQSGRAIDCSE